MLNPHQQPKPSRPSIQIIHSQHKEKHYQTNISLILKRTKSNQPPHRLSQNNDCKIRQYQPRQTVAYMNYPLIFQNKSNSLQKVIESRKIVQNYVLKNSKAINHKFMKMISLQRLPLNSINLQSYQKIKNILRKHNSKSNIYSLKQTIANHINCQGLNYNSTTNQPQQKHKILTRISEERMTEPVRQSYYRVNQMMTVPEFKHDSDINISPWGQDQQKK